MRRPLEPHRLPKRLQELLPAKPARKAYQLSELLARAAQKKLGRKAGQK